MAFNPSARPSLDDISERLLTIRDSISSVIPPTLQQPPPEVASPKVTPPPTPPQASTPQRASFGVRQALSRNRINATQTLQPVRRQEIVSLQDEQAMPVTRQALTRGLGFPRKSADQIPVDLGRITKPKLQSRKSARVRSKPADAEGDAEAGAEVADVTGATDASRAGLPSEMEDGNENHDGIEGVRMSCLGKLWRTEASCCMTKGRETSLEETSRASAQSWGSDAVSTEQASSVTPAPRKLRFWRKKRNQSLCL